MSSASTHGLTRMQADKATPMECDDVRRGPPLRFHDLANIFPLIEGEEFDALVADIKSQGLHEPVVIYQERILDGRNRYRACVTAGIDCPSAPYTGNDPVGYVISRNLKRRHLNESQRAMVAAKLATLRRGDNQNTEGLPIGRSSELLNVGERSIARAREVLDRGTPELAVAVERGQVSVSAAAYIATETPEQQREIVARGEAEILAAAKVIRSERILAKRAAKKAEYNARIAAAKPKPLEGTYRIIYADPPYKYHGLNRNAGHAEDHYDCLDDDQICEYRPGDGKRSVRELADDNAVLFLWVTAPMLERCFKIVRAWGFEYKASFVWDKARHVMGHYNSVRHELLLICTRGSCTPDTGKLIDSVQRIERSDRHSEKPHEFYAIIDAMYDYGRKLELFSRGSAPKDWDTDGNESDQARAA